METPPLTEVVLGAPPRLIGRLPFETTPEPGSYLELAGQSYQVLERRHQYQLRAGRYQLQRIVLSVQAASMPAEKSFWHGRWVIGDVSCRYNARSEMLRCAVNPAGPCDRCCHHQPIDPR